MVCPRCASNQSDDIKFCTSCGTNLQAVREALEVPDAKRLLGITAEVKRYNEIKAGVIVSSVGVGLAIFLHIFMQGIAGQVAPHSAEIITRIWVAGIIPILVGLALIVNGTVVSKKIVEAQQRALNEGKTLDEGMGPRGLRAADTNQFIPTNLSVTDGTTRHLENSERKVSR